MNFYDLQTAVLYNSFRDAYRDTAARLLNEAVLDVCRRLELFYTRAVVAYDAQGALVSAPRFFRIDDVWVASGPASTNPQDLVTQAQYRLYPQPVDRSAGGVYAYQDVYIFEAVPKADSTGLLSELRVYPTRGNTGFVAVTGYAAPAQMVNSTDTSGLGTELDQALIAYARTALFQLEDDPQMSTMWLGEYERALRTRGMAKITTTGPVVTPGDPHYL